MADALVLTVDKFTFRIATDRFYTSEGMWVMEEVGRLRVGLSDFLQQRSGDVAFAEVRPVGTALAAGDEMAVIETIKVNISLVTPITGQIGEVNAALSQAPEAINQDPYGAGWIAMLSPTHWPAERSRLLTPQAYFDQVKGQADEEAQSL